MHRTSPVGSGDSHCVSFFLLIVLWWSLIWVDWQSPHVESATANDPNHRQGYPLTPRQRSSLALGDYSESAHPPAPWSEQERHQCKGRFRYRTGPVRVSVGAAPNPRPAVPAGSL